MDPHDHPSENGEGHVYHETFVFTGNGGQAFLATMQNLMNRMMHGQPQAQPAQPEQPEESAQHEQPEQQEQPEQPEHSGQPEHPRSEDTNVPTVNDPPILDVPLEDEDVPMPPPEPSSNSDHPPGSRPIRPLPRPHTHFHAHTPGGIIDLFTFNVGGPLPPPPPPGTTTFTLNFGPDILAGFEAFFLGGTKDREPDPERARVLLRAMEVVPEGLVRRLERAGGVPGGQGTEDSAGCAVCWGPLVDEVEPGEWDTAKQKEDKAKMASEGNEKTAHDDDDLHGRIVALPCAHVYHAECLLPWFSRNTTCPTCRFDVDPESLTWTPRPPANEPPPPPHIPPEVPDGVPHPEVQDGINAHAEHHQRTNAINAARFNAFVNSIFRLGTLGHPQPPQPPQPAPQSQTGAQPQQQAQQAQQEPRQEPQQEPQQQQSQVHAEPPVFVHDLPLPYPQPNPFQLPPLLPTLPVVFVPPHTQPPRGPWRPWGMTPNIVPPLPLPPSHTPNAAPQRHPHPDIHPTALHTPSNEDPSNIPHPHTRPSQAPPPRRERKKWTPPEPIGKTLRQRVEEKERELGLRCDDVVCGVAPSDEDPTPAALQSGSETKRITLRAAYDGHGKACSHSFHPACLVTSARVAGVTGETEHGDRNRDGEGESGEDGDLPVACPACRAVGLLTLPEWDEGVKASEAEIA